MKQSRSGLAHEFIFRCHRINDSRPLVCAVRGTVEQRARIQKLHLRVEFAEEHPGKLRAWTMVAPLGIAAVIPFVDTISALRKTRRALARAEARGWQPNSSALNASDEMGSVVCSSLLVSNGRPMACFFLVPYEFWTCPRSSRAIRIMFETTPEFDVFVNEMARLAKWLMEIEMKAWESGARPGG